MPERLRFRQQPGLPKPKRFRPTTMSRGYAGKDWEATRTRVFIRDNWQCRGCGRVCSGKGEAHCDHIVPKAQGGTDEDSNLQTLCERCHGRKTQREKQGP